MTAEYDPQLLPPPYKYINIFISHATNDKAIAEYYERLLRPSFTVWHFETEMLPGQDQDNRPVDAQLEEAIRRCDYFLLIISDHSMSPHKPYCARELGLALHLQEERRSRGGMSKRSPRPIIIPIYSKQMDWRSKGESLRPAQFPVRNFWTSEPQKPCNIIGHDPHGPVVARTDEELLLAMKPRVYRVRRDIQSDDELRDSGVLELYESIFDPIDQHDPDDLANWVLRLEDGTRRSVALPKKRSLTSWSTHTIIKTQLNSLFYYVRLYNTTVALCYLNFQPGSGLMVGNYIAAGSAWRGSGLILRFLESIESDITQEYTNARGILFGVEPIEFELLGIFADSINSNVTLTPDNPVYGHIRRLKRLAFYQRVMRARLYMDTTAQKPLVHTFPCLDIELAQDKWKENGKEYWLMWYSPKSSKVPTYKEAINFYCLEVFAKSLVLMHADETGSAYWSYANEVAEQNIDQAAGRQVSLGMIPIRHLMGRLNKVVKNFGDIAI